MVESKRGKGNDERENLQIWRGYGQTGKNFEVARGKECGAHEMRAEKRARELECRPGSKGHSKQRDNPLTC